MTKALAFPYPLNRPDSCGDPECPQARLVCAPLFVSHVMCDDVCTCDPYRLVHFQLEQSLLLPGQKQPQAFFP